MPFLLYLLSSKPPQNPCWTGDLLSFFNVEFHEKELILDISFRYVLEHAMEFPKISASSNLDAHLPVHRREDCLALVL